MGQITELDTKEILNKIDINNSNQIIEDEHFIYFHLKLLYYLLIFKHHSLYNKIKSSYIK